MTTEVITTTAQAAKYAARAFAHAISLDRRDLSAEHVEALAGELREILTSARLALRVIEQAAPDAATATDLREAKHSAPAAARNLSHAYRAPLPVPTAATPADGFTAITEPGEIETLTHGRKLIVDETVFRISRTNGCRTYVRDLPGIDFIPPALFIEMFREVGILIRS